MLINVRGIKLKTNTIQRILEEEKPVMVALVETKLRKMDEYKIPGYKIERVDRDEEGGGVLIAIKETLNETWITTTEYKKHDCEMLWVKFDKMKIKIKIGIVYMPQESRTKVKILEEIYSTIETEIKDAAEGNYHLLLVGDLNCKIGNSMIKRNTSNITTGGRLLNKMLKRNRLIIGNAQETCEGLWTRIEGQQKSVLDYVIMFEEDTQLFVNMKIDEDKTITPYYIDENNVRTYTDHCTITGTLNIMMAESPQPKYVKAMTEKAWAKFREEIEEKEINKMIDGRDIRTSYKEWSDTVIMTHEKCKQKVKRNRPWKVSRKLIANKKNITRMLKETNDAEQIANLKMRRKIIIEQIEEEEHKQRYQRIKTTVEDIKRGGGIHSDAFWKVREKLIKKPEEAAHMMQDDEGNMCENPDDIRKIHADWYKQLLTTSKGTTAVEKDAEQVIKQIWNSMKIIAKNKPPIKTTREEIDKVVQKLDIKKAKDSSNWNNKIIKEGGEEILKSLKKIIEKVDEQREIPEEWQEMEIKVTHKKGDKTRMSNKRGLFLTNNISKVYERIVKERNSENYTAGISEWSNGGLKRRAAIDNIMIINSIIEQNKYLKRNTYLTFTDAEKCFDKLWLQDGIFELWRSGTDVRDCYMIKKLNERAKIVVRTPVGNTEAFYLENIVRQGTVYGPQICTSSMDRVNKMGKDVATPYGPNLPIRAVAFVDDVNAAGGGRVADNLINNCKLMEQRKKMTFNNNNSKTEYMVIGGFEEEPYTVTNQVLRGRINRVLEHKALGSWFDESGDYGINITKKTETLQFMISTVKYHAHPKNIGVYAVQARLNLAEVVVIPSILYNIEAYHVYEDHEIANLERVQHKVLIGILELPTTTPYYSLLMETGWWTIRGRIAYRKLMLYHNIITSDNKRVIKKIIKVQEEKRRSTTWYASVRQEMSTYNIEISPEESLKSKWKKEVKQKINTKMEQEIREHCRGKTKGRTVIDDEYERKEYLDVLNLEEARKILRMRMHMSKIPGNYKGRGEGKCTLCQEEKGNMEHYYRCKSVRQLVEVWRTKEDDIRSLDKDRMKAAAHFIEKVEIMMEPMKIGQTQHGPR